MLTYQDRLLPEAALENIDNGTPFANRGMKTLAGMARNPATIAAVNRAREIAGNGNGGAGKNRLAHLNRTCGRVLGGEKPTDKERRAVVAVWDTLPGYTCFADALAIAARL